MLFKLSNLDSNLALTLGYLNPASNNLALHPEILSMPVKGFGKGNFTTCSSSLALYC